MKRKDIYEIPLPPRDYSKIRSGVKPGKIIEDAKTRSSRWRKRKHRKDLREEDHSR